MTTGERIKEARIRAGLTQSELAEKIGVKFSAVHKYETGMVVNLKRDTISAIAKALDVRPSWLMCMEDEEEENLDSAYKLLKDLQFFAEKEKPSGARELSDEERELIELYRRMSDDLRKAILAAARAAASAK